MPQLSIVVNYRGESQPLEATLVSVLENRPPDCEVIVVHDGSYADPYDLDGEVAFVYAKRNLSRIEQVNAGLQAASGKIVHTLKAGWTVSDNWWQAGCQPLLDYDDVAMVVPLVVDSGDPQKIICAGLRYDGWRRQEVGVGKPLSKVADSPSKVLGPSLNAGFYRREDLLGVGRFPTVVGDALADVDLALSLNHAGLGTVVATDSIVNGTKEATERSSYQTGLYNERLFWRHARFLGWKKAIAGYPLRLMKEWLTGCWMPSRYQQLVGRVRGFLERNDYQSFHEQAAHFQRRRRRQPMTRRLHGRTVRVDGAHHGRRTDDPSVRV